MELLVIKGKSEIGKTTIATLLHNKVAQIEGIQLKWMMYDHKVLPIEEKDFCGDSMPDFRSVFLNNDRLIGIVSHGDSVLYAKQFIRQMINEFHVDILIVCSSIDGKNWEMLNKVFGDYIKEENVFDATSYYCPKDRYDGLRVKEDLVNDIINKINQIYSRI